MQDLCIRVVTIVLVSMLLSPIGYTCIVPDQMRLAADICVRHPAFVTQGSFNCRRLWTLPEREGQVLRTYPCCMRSLCDR
jgi:hypothetical protein